MTYKTLKTNLERELLLVLIMGLRHDYISKARAKIISAVVLKVFKGSVKCDEILDKVSKICQVYPEIMDPFIKVAKKYEEEEKSEKLDSVRITLNNYQIAIGGIN